MIAALLMAACEGSVQDAAPSSQPPGAPTDSVTACPSYGPPRRAGAVRTTGLDEISGVVASGRSPVLWVHEDSGNPAEIHAIEPDGTLRGSIEVRGAVNHDWEDIALADGTIWLGDIGDNERQRKGVQVYRFPEPAPTARSVTAEALHLRYEDGPHDAEAIVVDAREGALYVVTKELLLASAGVYRAEIGEARDGERRLLRHVGELDIGIVTAADLGPDGIVVKNYVQGRFYPWTEERDVMSALAQEGCRVPVGGGESIAFGPGGQLIAIPEGGTPPIFASAPE